MHAFVHLDIIKDNKKENLNSFDMFDCLHCETKEKSGDITVHLLLNSIVEHKVHTGGESPSTQSCVCVYLALTKTVTEVMDDLWMVCVHTEAVKCHKVFFHPHGYGGGGGYTQSGEQKQTELHPKKYTYS